MLIFLSDIFKPLRTDEMAQQAMAPPDKPKFNLQSLHNRKKKKKKKT